MTNTATTPPVNPTPVPAPVKPALGALPGSAVVTFPIYSATDASVQTVLAMVNSINTLTQETVQNTAIGETIGKMATDWGNSFQALLQKDSDAIKGTSGSGLAQAQAVFNTANTAATQSATGFSTLSNQMSQELTTLVQSMTNQQNIANSAGVGLSQAVISNNVL